MPLPSACGPPTDWRMPALSSSSALCFALCSSWSTFCSSMIPFSLAISLSNLSTYSGDALALILDSSASLCSILSFTVFLLWGARRSVWESG